jgi:YHS domain-containing protein
MNAYIKIITNMKLIVPTLSAVACLMATGCGSHDHAHCSHGDSNHDHHTKHVEQSQPKAALQGDPYTLAACPVSGRELGSMGSPVVHSHEGRELRFCCAGCIEPFNQESARFIKAADAAILKDQAQVYVPETCPITGMKLGAMGEPYPLVHRNRLVRFCCKGCDARFLKDPDPALEKLDATIRASGKGSYPLSTCLVSGRPLNDPFEKVWANRLLRFCSEACAESFLADPRPFLQKVDHSRSG